MGILYLCGTPIGNLDDISIRTLDTLKSVDVIYAEDTRRTLKLLNYFNIKTKLSSYHEHNKKERGFEIINLLKEENNVALVSDAGMPGISDPGEDLVKLCYENNIEVTTTPGATAVITALVLSGISTRRYVFEGFLPKDKKRAREIITSLKDETRTIVFYESPHQLTKTIKLLHTELGNRKISIARELTKKYEEVIRLNLDEAVVYFTDKKIRGEFVLVIEGKKKEVLEKEEKEKWEELSIDEHMEIYLQKGYIEKLAMKQVAKERRISKRDVYNYLVRNK